MVMVTVKKRRKWILFRAMFLSDVFNEGSIFSFLIFRLFLCEAHGFFRFFPDFCLQGRPRVQAERFRVRLIWFCVVFRASRHQTQHTFNIHLQKHANGANYSVHLINQTNYCYFSQNFHNLLHHHLSPAVANHCHLQVQQFTPIAKPWSKVCISVCLNFELVILCCC
jgi:hypothetical protein